MQFSKANSQLIVVADIVPIFQPIGSPHAGAHGEPHRFTDQHTICVPNPWPNREPDRITNAVLSLWYGKQRCYVRANIYRIRTAAVLLKCHL